MDSLMKQFNHCKKIINELPAELDLTPNQHIEMMNTAKDRLIKVNHLIKDIKNMSDVTAEVVESMIIEEQDPKDTYIDNI
ncbi:hypothetical protein GJ496_007435 [Pomphorhynchus laevis]|nr:hypothetical protein GJ496_007435 [Pomphorhynchus laevis]